MKIAMILMSLIVSGSAFAQHAPATPPPADQGAMHEEKAPEAAPAKKEHKKKKAKKTK